MKNVVGIIHYRWLISNIREVLRLQKEQLEIDCVVYGNDALVERARSMFCTQLMKLNYDSVLLIDSDIKFSVVDVLKIFKHLENPKYSIIGAMYPIKKIETQPASKQFEGQTIEYRNDAEPACIKYLSTGFMGIRREVLEKLARKLPLLYKGQEWEFYPFFKADYRDGQYISEDWTFCELARKYGFPIWIDPSIRLGHIGDYIYTLTDMTIKKEEIANIRITEK